MIDINPVVSNWEIFGLERSVKASKYPMAVDVNAVDSSITKTVNKLAAANPGSGHDNFLKGIIVEFDLTFTKQAWSEIQRYHFVEFVSSQSTIHRITAFDLDTQYIKYVDTQITKRMKELVEIHNANPTLHNYLVVIYSSPTGLQLTAGMTTNYQQLKTIYAQRRNHILPEWQSFCDWIEALPHSEWITGKKTE